MALSDQQKIDIIFKKLSYAVTKTGSVRGTGNIGGVLKDPNEEAIGSPLVIPNSSIWAESANIPATAPAASTAYVQVYGASTPLRMTKDSTITGNRTWFATTTFGNESTRVGDWIDPGNFGATYLAKIYVGPLVSGSVNAANALNSGGSGNNDSWYFDYAAGVLNFADTTLPATIGANDLYLVAYRYIGLKGASGGGGGSSQWVTTNAGIHTLSNVGIGTTNPTAAVTSANTSVLAAGIVTAFKFFGDGSGLTNLPGGSLTVQDEGTAQGSATTLNFTGPGVTASVASGTATINITGGGGSGISTQWVTTNAGIHTLSNVGIGTTNPLVALDVAGVIREEIHTPTMPVGLNNDIGVNWTQIEMGAALEAISSLVYCGNGIVLAGSGNDGGDGDIYRSTDFGLTWTKIEMGFLEAISSLVYCGNGIVLAGSAYATGRGDVYRSTDFGLTWTKIEMGASLESISSLVYCGNGIVLAGSGFNAGDGDIYRSTDFGLTWTQIEMGASLEYILSSVYCGNGIVLAGSGQNAGDGDIYRSTDFGLTWTQIEMGAALEYIFSLIYCGNGIVLAGSGNTTGDGDIYRSTDFGLTWTKIEMGASLESIFSLVYCGNGIVLAGSGNGTGRGDIYKSTDFGLTWTQIEMGSSLEYISSLVYCGNGIVLAGSGSGTGDGDIYRSDVGFSQASTIQSIYHQHLTGNIGIGTTNPATKLHVVGIASVSGDIALTYGSGSSASKITWGSQILLRSSGNDPTNASMIWNSGNPTSNPTSTNSVYIGAWASPTASGTSNVSIGAGCGYVLTTGTGNVFVGQGAAYFTTGSSNTFIGSQSGGSVTTGSNNTILGGFSGNSGGLDIRTSNNNVVIADGSGNIRLYANSSGNIGIGTTLPTTKLHVDGGANIVGTVTATAFVGDGSGLTNLPGGGGSGIGTQWVTTNAGIHTLSNVGIGTTLPTSKLHVVGGASISGVVTATSFSGKDNNLFTEWTLGSNGSVDYTFTGPGFTGSEFDPTIYLIRGRTYKFTNTMGAHPFRIQSTPNGSVGTQYNDGITNNDVSNGTLTWEVRHNAPSTLYYQCTAHAGMGGVIYILNEGTGGGGGGSSQWVTTNAGIHTLSNVGIGTTNPSGAGASTKLYVTGNERLTGSLFLNSGSQVQVEGSGGTYGDTSIEFVGGVPGVTGNGAINYYIRSGLSNYNQIRFTGSNFSPASGSLNLGTSSAPWNIAYLNSVGINTSNPTSPLTVFGNARIVGIVTATQFVGDGSGLTGIVATGSGIGIRDDGSIVGTATTINFGTNLDVTLAGGVATVNSAAASQAQAIAFAIALG